ncbi:LuxR C-terminal-related transcriptional regulator [Streptomyces sp. NPDC056486]|uniref:helix-turn-helix transcriptional regulator n=1 Tax=Streptomyces sp. NPDC056486 TaxID=3345835 RepID=UPI00367E2B29
MAGAHIPHGAEELCESGSATYIRALRESRILRDEAEQAPCLIDFGLLHPDVNDMRWLRPTAPAVALPRLLRVIEDHISHHRRREQNLTAAFQSFLTLNDRSEPDCEPSAVTVLEGVTRIDAAIDQAVAGISQEVLTVHASGAGRPERLAATLPREQKVLSQGGRVRALHQRTTHQSLLMLAHYEQLQGDVEVRSLDVVTEGLLVFDRTMALIPASKNPDRLVALEIRHTALVDYLATTFERLWLLATPMLPTATPQPPANGISTRQRAIAGLLVEGLTDTEIAARLGMNVRTARVHIAKLANTLGSNSRAQLGYLIGGSGILDD